mmetsp:Transcript_22588/g.52626  ORF Transcript_22588/g.52626 Transcript_22588/m.52626 type:complete len:856 (-) Transcript_22588:21-2588(-)
MPSRHRATSEVTYNRNEHQLAVYDQEEAARAEEETARAQAEFKMVRAIVGTVFSLKKPRDVIAGTTSGFKAVAGGVGIGVASLVAQPYLGAKSEGAKGFVKGMGTGMVTCLASTVAGTVIGSSQIVRGVLNTPNAIVQKSRGQVWNSEKRRWEQDWYSLPEEAELVLGSSSASASSSAGQGADGSGDTRRRPARKVVDKSLYDLLGVAPEATEAEIRKAFYKKSLELHPDKNPNNPEATVMFQAVSDAYRVLGSEDRRKLYDEHGKDLATQGLPKIEPAVFFAALFGSHHFEPYVGRLRLAQEIDGDLQLLLGDLATAGENDTPDIDILKLSRAHEHMKVVQQEREVKCAVFLRDCLMPVVGITSAERSIAYTKWEAEMRDEVEKLAKVTCGVEILYLVGWMYSNRARQWFAGGLLRSALAKVEGKLHLTRSKAHLAGQVCRTGFRVKGIVKKADQKKKDTLKAGKASEADGAAAAEGASSASAAPEPSEKESASFLGHGASAHADSEFAEGADAVEAGLKAAAEADARAAARAQARNSPNSPSTPEKASPSQKSAPSSAAAAEQQEDAAVLPPGSLVMVKGLQTQASLNDEVGVVVGQNQNGRYLVEILDTGEVKALKMENLQVLEAPSGAFQAGFTADGDDGEGGAAGSSKPSQKGSAGAEDQWAPGGDDADMIDAFKECMPLVHDTLWSATALDIEFTLNGVIHRVLKDMSVPKTVRRQRAHALLRLGEILQEPHRKKQSLPLRPSQGSRSKDLEPAADLQSEGNAGSPTASVTTTSSKRSMLLRLKPKGLSAFFRPSDRKDKEAKVAKEAENKRKKIEAAMAMMAAGASTEEVDEMVRVRAQMEAEYGSSC